MCLDSSDCVGIGGVWRPLRKMDTLNKLKQFDAYPKTLEDFRVKTWGGATGERLRIVGQRSSQSAPLAGSANNKASQLRLTPECRAN